MALSLCGFMALSLYGFIALWLYRFMALSLYRFMALSLYGFIALWLYKVRDDELRAKSLPNKQDETDIKGLSKLKLAELQNMRLQMQNL